MDESEHEAKFYRGAGSGGLDPIFRQRLTAMEAAGLDGQGAGGGNLSRERGPLWGELVKLGVTISRCGELVGALTKRLDQILAPSEPRSSDAEPGDRVGGSPLFCSVRMEVDRLAGVCSDLESLISRIEI